MLAHRLSKCMRYAARMMSSAVLAMTCIASAGIAAEPESLHEALQQLADEGGQVRIV